MIMPYKMYIAGKWVDASTGDSFLDLNPASGHAFLEIPMGGPIDAKLAIEAAENVAYSWSVTPVENRAAFLLKAAELLKANEDEFIHALILENGSTFKKAGFEVSSTIRMLRISFENFHQIFNAFNHRKRGPQGPHSIGIVAIFSASDFPLFYSMEKIASAIINGNTVVLKPSYETPVIGLGIAGLLETAGLPAGVLNVLTGKTRQLLPPFLKDDHVIRIELNTSRNTLLSCLETFTTNIHKIHFETCGKDLLVVLKDADIDFAVAITVRGVFMRYINCCRTIGRIIIEAPLVEKFSGKLIHKAQHLLMGNPANKNTQIGMMISKSAVQRTHLYVNDAVSRGARLLTGGSYDGCMYKPTVLSNVTSEMSIYKNEVLGPIAGIISVKNDEEALFAANDQNEYLSAILVLNDMKKAKRMSKKIDGAEVYIFNRENKEVILSTKKNAIISIIARKSRRRFFDDIMEQYG